MTVEELESLFDKHDGEFLKFDRVERKISHCPDLHAFMVMDLLLDIGRIGPYKKMIAGAEHDEIYLDPKPEELVKAGITEEQVIDLIRCGIRYNEEWDCLCMFV
jgi:hypothetical protein